MHPYVYCSIIPNSQWHITQPEKIQSHPLQQHDGSGGYYAKYYKLNRERQVPSDFTYMWNLKNKRKEQTQQIQTHRYREQTDDCQRKGRLGGWVKKGKGVKKYKLVVTK